VVKPSRRRDIAKTAVCKGRLNVRQACEAFSISQTCFRYTALLNDENEEIADWLLRLTQAHRHWGFQLCFLVKGFGWNHKPVYRIYCELKLNLRIKPKKRIKRDKPEALSEPEFINEIWSMVRAAGGTPPHT